MIVVLNMNNPIDTSMFTNLEKEIYTQKNASSTTYTYDSLDQLKFEIAFRVKIIDAARALLASKAAFTTFKKSRCNWKYWIRTEQGGFQLRAEAPPSAAIRDIFKSGGLYAFECATAMVIVLYKAMLDMIGEERFNTLFTNLLLWDWNYDSDLHLITVEGVRESFPGDILYFVNPDVSLDTPEWQGENVVKLGNNAYYGHGIGNKNAKQMIAYLNMHRKPNSKQTAYLKNQVTYPDYNYIHKMISLGTTSFPYRFHSPFANAQAVATIGSSSYIKL
ncbi:MAG: protein-glutamine gamma-glutamyltransferase [Bacilli bacterium]|nr:protein-glutamine gamma-glutamyltransferase [Bacilli bacterium]